MPVTCADYRLGRRLLALKTRLAQDNLDQQERRELEQEVAELEHQLGMD